jgi:hypothetical protein
MEMLAFVVATLLFGGLVVAAIRLWLTADLGGSTAPTPSPSPSPSPIPNPSASPNPSPNLETMTLVKLQALAKSKGLTGVSRLPKAALIEKLRTT